MSGDAAGWQNFYLMTGGAAAALTGLIFVALSLQAKAIVGHPLFRDRALVSLASLMGAIFLSAVVLVPGQPPLALGLEVAIVVAFFAVRLVRAAWLFRSVGARARRRPGPRWVIEWTVWSLWFVVFAASAVELGTGAPGGYFLLGVAIVWMFALNIWNAWVLIEEVAAQPTTP